MVAWSVTSYLGAITISFGADISYDSADSLGPALVSSYIIYSRRALRVLLKITLLLGAKLTTNKIAYTHVREA